MPSIEKDPELKH